ncbi:MAG: hypothetical protein KAI99_14475, partial [Cyclobacteriaceae bacterium]|nr:hypothetical protein [Cyclobacteriaceae bacterium]
MQLIGQYKQKNENNKLLIINPKIILIKNKKVTCSVHFILALMLMASVSVSVFGQTNQRPNVVFMVADNVGYGDIGRS